MRYGFGTALLAVAWLGVSLNGTARADELPLILLVQDLPAFRDLTLAVHGRQALSTDRDLRELNLAVQVKKGFAELRGRVPSVELARKAVQLVEEVQGILGVRNYLEVRPVTREPARLVLEPELPSSTRAALPNREALPEIPLSVPSMPSIAVREPAVIQRVPPTRVETPAEPAPLVVLLPPVFMEERVRPPRPADILVARPRPEAIPATTQDAIEEILAEPTYRGLKIERRGAVVYLHQRSGHGARVMALARRLSGLPQVEQIVLVPEGR